MTNDRDRDLVEGIRSGRAVGVVLGEDPPAVAAEVARDAGTVVVDVVDLAGAVAAARVRLAELVLDRARQAEARRSSAPSAEDAGEDPDDVDPEAADRQAVRFALVILLLALPAGIAVYLADGLLVAPALPALALLGLGVVVLVHRRAAPGPARPHPDPVGDLASEEEVEASPSVRAAHAHLRRQRAAWKVTWWARSSPVPELDGWSVQLPRVAPITLVALDPHGDLDDAAVAAMTATVPAAVRVVVLQPSAS